MVGKLFNIMVPMWYYIAFSWTITGAAEMIYFNRIYKEACKSYPSGTLKYEVRK